MEVLSSITGYEPLAVCITTVAIITLTVIAAMLNKHYVAQSTKRRLPPGSFGFPIIGETISFVRALQQNTIDEWFQRRIDKYGPAFKTSIMGKKTMVITGQAGNRFVLGGNSNNNGLTTNLPAALTKIFGKTALVELSGPRHMFLRKAVQSFLDPESIQRYLNRADLIVKQQIFQELNGKDSIIMVPFIKRITFKVACSLLFGIPEGEGKDEMYEDSTLAIKGMYTIPLDLPGTTFHTAIQARTRLCKRLYDVMMQRKEEMLNKNKPGHEEDIISCFLNLRDENGRSLAEVEILDNLINLIMASHDTLTSTLSVFIQKLARSPDVYDKVLEEQREVVKAINERDGKFTWSEIQRMKYTWTVAQELMRLLPPLFGNFRYATRDTTFNAFDIPKGWQVFWVASPTHMDKDIFQDPEAFNPSRFDNQSKALIPPYTYIPFGAGPRICPGSEFARTILLLVIHHLVLNYSWAEMIPDETITCRPTPCPAMSLPVKLYPKQGTPE